MSLPDDTAPDPHADPLVASVMRVAADVRGEGCPEAEWLALYADGELAGAELGLVRPHLASCERCQAIVAAYERARPVPAAAGAGIIAGWLAGWRWMVPLASATAVLAVAVWIGRGPADEVARQAPSAAAPGLTAPAPPDASLDLQARQAPSGTRARLLTEKADAAPGAPPVSAAAPESAEARRNAVSEQGFAPSPPGAPPADLDARPTTVPPPPAAVAAAPAPAPADRRAADASAAAGEAQSTAQRVERAQAAPSSTAEAMVAAPRPAAAGAAPQDAAMATLAGTVTYRSRVALPPGAVIEVRLLDVSRADAPATTIARTDIITRGEQVPVPFTLSYAVGAIQPRRRYAVQATIAIDGRVAWRTTTQQPVLDGGVTPVSVVVEPTR